MYREISTKRIKINHKYSNNIFSKKIAIIGLCPPPLGGIAIHIKRVSKKLIEQNNEVLLIDIIKESKKRNKLKYLFYLFNTLKNYKSQIVYLHTLSLRNIPLELIVILALKIVNKNQIVIVDHTPRFFYKLNIVYKKIINMLLYFVDQQVLIGDSTYKAYIDNKIYISSNFSMESPFLSPDLKEFELIFNNYPKDLKHFLDSHLPLILINGSSIRIWNEIDLYGFDMAVKLIIELSLEFPNCGLVIVLAQIGDKNYFNSLLSQIKDHSKHIFLLIGCEQEVWPLLKKMNLFIRPTSSDAYGISIEEALLMKTQVVASDVCQRPRGTILFKSRNYEDFYCKVQNALLFDKVETQNQNKIKNI